MPNTNTDSQTAEAQLRSIIERIERLNEEIRDLNSKKHDIFVEARSGGFDPKAIKAVVRLRAQDPIELRKQNLIVKTYLSAVGAADEDLDDDVPLIPDTITPKIDQALSREAS